MKRVHIPIVGALALVLGCGFAAAPAWAFGEGVATGVEQPDAVPSQVQPAQPSAEAEGDGADRSAAPSQDASDSVAPAVAPALTVESDGAVMSLKVGGFSSAPSNVAFSIASQGGATQWVQALGADDGSWTASVPVPSSGIRWGKVAIAAWATIDGGTAIVANKAATVPVPTTRISAVASGDFLKLSADNWSSEPQNVAFAVTTPTGGAVWFQGTHQSNGSWAANPSIARELGFWGVQKVEVYATFNTVTASFGATQVNVGLGSVSTRASASGTAVSLAASGWDTDPANVAFEIAGPSGSSRWVQAKRQSDGSWTASISVTADLKAWGAYTVRTWASLGSITAPISNSSFTASAGSPRVVATGEGAAINLAASGWSVQPANVAFQVKRPSGGEVWIQARRDSSGAWIASTSVMAGGILDSGTYTVTAWATHGEITAPAGSSSLDAKAAGPSVSARVSGQRIAFTAGGFAERPSNVAFEVRTPSGRVMWLQGSRASNGAWSSTLDAASTVGEPGSYTAVLWATFDSRSSSYASASATVQPLTAEVTISMAGTAAKMRATAWSAQPSNVAFEVIDGGKSIWVQGVRGADGAWTATAPSSDSAIRRVRVWGTLGKMTAVAGSAAISTHESAASVNAVADGTTFTFTASDWKSAPSNVAFQLITPAGKEIWLQAAKRSDGSWFAASSVGASGGSWGVYALRAWATVDGATRPVGSDSLSVSAGAVSTTASTSGTTAHLAAAGWALMPSNVAFKVIRPSGEALWIQGVKQGDGSWTADADLARTLKAWGAYTVQPFATIDGFTYGFDAARFSFSAGSTRVSRTVADTWFSLSVSGWTRVPTNVAFRIDTPAGQRWLQARRQPDGSWAVQASQGDGFWAQGTCTATAFATIEGVTSSFGSTSFQFPIFQNAMHQRAQWYKSNTDWLLLVDTASCRVGVYHGRQGKWDQVFYWLCSPGAPATPTVKGEFTVASRGYVFGHGYSCYYWTQFYGDYLFHSVLYNQNSSTIQDGRLGQRLSRGCVRLAIENAHWINQNIPSGTKVVVY